MVKLLAYISDKDLFSGQSALAGGCLLVYRAAAGLCGNQQAGPGISRCHLLVAFGCFRGLLLACGGNFNLPSGQPSHMLWPIPASGVAIKPAARLFSLLGKRAVAGRCRVEETGLHLLLACQQGPFRRNLHRMLSHRCCRSVLLMPKS